jgi:hypothetical protein
VALVTTIAVIFPFSTTAALDAKVATALVNLAIGITIGALVGGVATRSIRERADARPPRPAGCGGVSRSCGNRAAGR